MACFGPGEPPDQEEGAVRSAEEQWGEVAPADVPIVTFLRDQLAEARTRLADHDATTEALAEQERVNVSLRGDLKAARAEIARLRKSVTALERSRAKLQKELADRKRLGTEQSNALKELRAKNKELDARAPSNKGRPAPSGVLALRQPLERTRS
jgi:chromosome segregation ATPase